MKKKTTKFLMLVTALLCCGQTWADSGASDRSKAFGYVFTPAELNDSFPQITNIPTVYLQVYKTTYDATTDKTSFTLNNGQAELEDLSVIFGNKNEWYYKTKIVIRDDWGTIKERNEWLGVRGRGNATWNIGNYQESQKKPLRLKFPSKTKLLASFENGVEVNNYADAKNWTLLANHYDATMIHNAMANEVGKKLGLPFCPAYKFVDLVVNGKYKGTYQISDQVQVGAGRVDINESTGYFIEICSSNFKEDPWIQVNNIGIVNVKSPDPDIIGSDAQASADPKYNDLNTYLNKVSDLAKSGPYNAPENWRNYVDVESAVKAFIAQEILANYDAGQGNNYAYMNDLESKIYFGPIWDFDLALNNKVNGKDMSGQHFWGGSGATFALFCKNIYENDPYFVKALYEEWQTIYDNGQLVTYLQSKVDEIANSISQSATLNYKSSSEGGAGQYLNKSTWNDSNNYTDLAAAYTSLKSFLSTHIEYLNTEFKAQYEALNCANLPEITIPEGLVDLGEVEKWSNKAHQYSFYGNKTNMVKNAKLVITTTARFDALCNDPYTAWIKNSSGTYERTLSEEDVANLKSNGYMFDIYVWDGGTCTSVTLTPPTCSTHDYTNCTYAKQEDGTYRRVCTACSQEETDGEVYYLFNVYAESSTPTELYATDWAPETGKPNSVAYVTVGADVVTQFSSHNIIVNGVCADFRLTDGYPFVSGDKFTATKATYSRNMSNTWGTICLPYKYQMAENETAKFYHLAGIEDANGMKSFVLESIDPSNGAGGYKPVFVQKKEGNAITVTGTKISVKKYSSEKTNSTVENWTLVGTTEPSTINVKGLTGKDIYYIANNQFWHATGTVTINPFRAYIENTSGDSATSAINIMVAGEEDTNAIDQLNAGTAMAICIEQGGVSVTVPQDMEVNIYSIGGALVSRASAKAGQTVSTQLPAGVYTINGVKVLVK